MRLAALEFRPGPWPTLAAVLLLALFVALGIWQLQRAAQKRALVREYEARSSEAPVPIDSGAGSAQALRHRHVRARGTYDHGRQFLLDNRTHRGAAGYQVLTPLRLAPGPAAVMVNRGWVPLGPSRERLPPLPAPAGTVRIGGIVSEPGADPFLLGPAGYGSGGWPRVVQSIDLAQMQRLLGYPLLPYVVRLDPAADGGFVREWRPDYGLSPQRHTAYAFQWFTLAAAVLAVYVAVNTRRRGAADEPD